MKKAGNWYSYLSGSQSTLKIHVADMKTPLLKVANHTEVCHVAFVKQFFIFISIYTKMRTGSQNPSDVHFLDYCSPVAFIISPTFTRQLYSGNSRVRYTGGHCWKQETSAGEGKEEAESQVMFRFQCLKISRRTRII